MAQMTIVDRNSIEDGLRRGLSIPEIAKLIGRPPQTVTNEIKSRRIDSAKGLKTTNSTCRWYGECRRTQVCDTHCGMRKPRPKDVVTKTDAKCRVGRTHELFVHWKMQHPGVRVVEADTLKRKVGVGYYYIKKEPCRQKRRSATRPGLNP